ncbi:MAG: FtsX-like permease family protein [Acidobacteria bacterium]|nr:FtsX-like permease family protein [Acidobacteriota bacterium]
MKLLRWLYCCALRAYPASFRRRFADDLVAAFDDGMSNPEWAAHEESRWLFALRSILDALNHGLRRRLRRAPATTSPSPILSLPVLRRANPLDTTMRDILWGLRALQQRPSMALAVILTLTIGIGATTAMFSLMDAVLFRELPYPASDRLVAVQQRDTRTEQVAAPISPANYLDLREASETFEDVAGTLFRPFGPTVRIDDEPAFSAQVFTVTYNLFEVLRTEPALGRGFSSAEADPEGPKTAILSHDFWMRTFGGAPTTLGRTLSVGGIQREIIGVMPEGFYVEVPVDMWIPMDYDARVHFALAAEIRHIGMLNLIGRLADRRTPAEASAEMTGLLASLVREYPEDNEGIAAVVRTAKERQVSAHTETLWYMGAAVAGMLVIAALNMAVLLVAAAASRQSEISTRLALGSSRRRLVQQGLAESLILSLAGAVGGGFLAVALIRSLLGALPANLPRQSEIVVDARAWGFGLGVAVVAGVVFGLMPLWLHMRTEPIEALRSRSGKNTGSARLRRALIVAEVALAFVLLIGSGVLLRSLDKALRVDPGFTIAGVMTTGTAVPAATAESAEGRIAHFTNLRDELLAIPGVVEVGYSSRTPLRGNSVETEITIEGRPATPNSPMMVEFRRASAEFFPALQIPLVNGRLFDPQDRPDTMPVAIINASAERQHFAGDAVGRQFSWNNSGTLFTVVGVVGDIRHFGLDSPATPEMYISTTQFPNDSSAIFVRTSGDASALATPIRQRVQQANPADPVPTMQTMDGLVADSLTPRRFPAILVSGFGLFALLLSAMGLYGVLVYLVEERSHEIGVRMALGAGPSTMARSVVADGLRTTAVGLVIGVPIALLATRSLGALLFDVSPTDPLTYIAIAALLLGVAATASLVAGRRATRVDPAAVLTRS